MHSTKNEGLDYALLKVNIFLEKIEQLLIQNVSDGNLDEIRKQLLYVKISKSILHRARHESRSLESSLQSSQHIIQSEADRALLSSSLCLQLPSGSTHQSQHEASNEEIFSREGSLNPSLKGVLPSSLPGIESEIEELAVMLFEEANLLVIEERKKQLYLQSQIAELQYKIYQMPTGQDRPVDSTHPIEKPDNFNQFLLTSVDFEEFRQENKPIFKSFSGLVMNEKIFIDGIFLSEFQDFLNSEKECLSHSNFLKDKKVWGDSSSLWNSSSKEEKRLMICFLNRPFVKKIIQNLIEPILSTFKSYKHSQHAVSKKKWIEILMKSDVTFEKKMSNFCLSSPKGDTVDKCFVCGYERNCEFLMAFSEDVNDTNSVPFPVDRFCREKILSITKMLYFLYTECQKSTSQSLITLFRTLIRHMHQLSTCLIGGAVVSQNDFDSNSPDIDIIN